MADSDRSEMRCGACGERLQAVVSGTVCPRCLLEGGLDIRTGNVATDEAPTMLVAGEEGGGIARSITPMRDGVDTGDRVLSPNQVIGGRYRIIQKLGRGGMGVVYRARQMHVDREVALKTISPGVASEGLMHRMAGEISTLGRMNHPNIVRVFDADVDDPEDGRRPLLYFTMEIVDGETLDSWLAVKGGRTIDEKLECFAGICDAVAFAHDGGVIHRDLKPRNIMVRANGKPAVLDFGISRVRKEQEQREALGDERSRHAAGSGNEIGPPMMTGTPEYMSPAKWRSEDDLEAGDLFALGVILFEMLTGRRPWTFPRGAPLAEIQETILNHKAPPVASVVKDTDVRIDALAGKLLNPDAFGRPTASEALWTVRDIIARRARRAAIRRWAPAIVAGTLLAVGLSGWGAWRMWVHNRRVDSEMRYQEFMLKLETSGRDPHAESLRLLPSTQIERHDSTAWRNAVVRAAGQWRMLPRPGPGPGLELPEGWRVVAADSALDDLLVADADGRVSWWAGGRRTPLPDAGRPGKIVAAMFSPDSRLAAINRQDGHVFIWDRGASEVIDLGAVAIGGGVLAFSEDGVKFACGTTEAGGASAARILLWEVGEWKRPTVLRRGSDPSAPLDEQIAFRDVKRLAFSEDGRFLAAAGERRHVFIWDTDSGEVHAVLHHLESINALAWSSANGESLLATGQRGGQVLVWKIGDSPAEGTFRRDPDFVFGGGRSASLAASAARRDEGALELLAWLPGDAELMAVHVGGRVEAWGLWKQEAATRAFKLDVGAGDLQWHPTARALSATSRNLGEPMRVWDWEAGPCAARLFLARPVEWLDMSGDGSLLVAGGGRGGAVVDLHTGEVVLPIGESLTGAPRFDSPRGRLWIAAADRGVVRIDPKSFSGGGSFSTAGQAIWKKWRFRTRLAFARREGSMVIARGTDLFHLERADVESPEPALGDEAVLQLDTAEGLDLALHGDGEWLVARWENGSGGGLFRHGSARHWTLDAAFAPSSGAAFAFGEDPQILTVFHAPRIRRWRLAESRFQDSFKVPGFVSAPARGSFLAVSSETTTAVVADALHQPVALRMEAAGIEEWARLDAGNAGVVRALALSPDGRFAAVAVLCWSGTLLTVWDLKGLQSLLGQLEFEPLPLAPDGES